MSARRRFISLIAAQAGHIVATGAPEGYDALVLSEEACSRSVLHVCRDDARMAAMSSAVRFFAPDLDVFEFPAWDCLPYDRVSPNPEIVARRLDALGEVDHHLRLARHDLRLRVRARGEQEELQRTHAGASKGGGSPGQLPLRSLSRLPMLRSESVTRRESSGPAT